MSLQTWYINLAPDALSHRDLVLGSHRHRGRSCVEPSRSAANCNGSIGSGRSDCTTFGPVRARDHRGGTETTGSRRESGLWIAGLDLLG
jgi:hypothetical protein